MKKTFLTMIALAALSFSSMRSYAQAELQVIHNSADPAAATVDVYVNGVNALNDFGFRTATSFLTLPSGVPINIGVAPGNSMSVNDTLANFTVTLAAGQKYIALASGVLNPAAFAANPDGKSTAFGLNIIPSAQTTSQLPGNVDLVINHGSTDAPIVDIIARNVATLVDNAAYGDVAGYLGVPPSSYIIDITPGNDNSQIVASFQADLTTLAGGAAAVFASGFLTPSANQNGPAFGVFAALPNGTVIALPAVSQSRLQVIHNAADPGAASVDVYLNGALAIPGFAFRTATPFIDVPAGVTVNIGIAPPNSTSVNDTLVNIPVTFENGKTYVAIANGVLNPVSFAANPDGRPTGFQLFLQDGIRESALNPAEVDFVVFHGSTDAQTVDVKLTGGPVLVDNAAYGDLTAYLSVPPASYSLDITPGNDNSIVVASYQADLTTLGGGAAVVFASGFLNPGTNQNGPAFGVWVTLPDGTTFPLPVTTGINDPEVKNDLGLYPNPVNTGSSVSIPVGDMPVTLEIMNTTGQLMKSERVAATGNNFEFNTSGLVKGIYMIRTISEKEINTGRLVIQ